MMSFSVGAALKKVAVSLLTDKKVLKWAGGIVLGALIIIMIPFAVIISLGTGQIKIDTEGLKAAVKAEMNEADWAKIEQMDKILGQITSKIEDADFGEDDEAVDLDDCRESETEWEAERDSNYLETQVL